MNDTTVCTNWTRATTNLLDAIESLHSAIKYGCNAWIEIRKNGDQAYPIEKNTGAENNPFNWTGLYGLPKALENHKYLNDTERDLTENWMQAFGDAKAIEEYQKNGTLSPELLLSQGIAHPIRKSDAYKINPKLENFKWVQYWKLKSYTERFVVDTDISDVYVICHDANIQDKNKALKSIQELVAKASIEDI